MQQQTAYRHIEPWTRPRCYFGPEWWDYFSAGVGRSRESDAVERANFDAMVARLGGESNTVKIVRDAHWAVGWIEWIAIHESDANALRTADDALEELEQYPLLDDVIFCQYENEDCEATWDCFNWRDRIEFLRNHSFTASFRDLIAAVRGSWYAASNALHCPSDILA